MKIVIAGGHDESDFLIAQLLKDKHELIVINEEADYCDYLAHKYPQVTILHGNPRKQHIFEDANIYNSDVLIALTLSDADNLAICQCARKVFSVRKVLCTVANPKNVTIFKQLGVNTAISSTFMIADFIAKTTTIENLMQALSTEDEQIVFRDINVDKDSPYIDTLIKDCRFPKNVIIGCVIRGERMIVPNGNTEIKLGDRLIEISAKENEPDE